jgi:hypothetical protein
MSRSIAQPTSCTIKSLAKRGGLHDDGAHTVASDALQHGLEARAGGYTASPAVMATNSRQSFFIYINIIDVKLRFFSMA